MYECEVKKRRVCVCVGKEYVQTHTCDGIGGCSDEFVERMGGSGKQKEVVTAVASCDVL